MINIIQTEGPVNAAEAKERMMAMEAQLSQVHHHQQLHLNHHGHHLIFSSKLTGMVHKALHNKKPGGKKTVGNLRNLIMIMTIVGNDQSDNDSNHDDSSDDVDHNLNITYKVSFEKSVSFSDDPPQPPASILNRKVKTN